MIRHNDGTLGYPGLPCNQFDTEAECPHCNRAAAAALEQAAACIGRLEAFNSDAAEIREIIKGIWRRVDRLTYTTKGGSYEQS